MDDTEESPSDYEAHTEVPFIMDDLVACFTHDYYIHMNVHELATNFS